MIFEPLDLPGAFRVLPERKADMRGHFARTFCAREFAEQGLNTSLVQANTSFNARRGTLRGLHWQAAPHAEDKLVRAVRGKVWDALVDLRRDSPTFLQWHGEELSAENGVALYIPRGFAHGFVSLDDDTELLYLMSAFFEPNAARGARFDDAAFGIRWPTAGALVISERDLAFPGFDPAMAEP
jgi:dTDP-4-dehydrorhamnose 3,5-epimerase